MKRNFQRFREGPFDLLVIGGGIHGAWTAYDAALRGLKVALVEKEDWASGTSSASSKLIHGGLRYLEYFRLGFVRKSLKERERFFVLAPHRVRPLRFIFPIYKGDRIKSAQLKAGLWLYDLMALSDQKVKKHTELDAQQWSREFPYLSRDRFVRGYSFSDGVTDDARLTLEIVAGASAAGVVVVNHARVVQLLWERNRVVGALVKDCLGRESIEVRARMTVDASGAWGGKLLQEKRNRLSFRLSKGVHLVMPALPQKETAFVLVAKSGRRICFLIPWYGRTILGTTDTEYSGDPASVRVDDRDIEELLAEANRIFRRRHWTRKDILGRYAGVRVLHDVVGKPSWALNREWVLEEPSPGLLLPVGGKLTTARLESERIVDHVVKTLGRTEVPCPTDSRLFPWAPRYFGEGWLEEVIASGEELKLDPETARNCAFRYGKKVDLLFVILKDSPNLAGRIFSDLPFCYGEIVHAVRYEMAFTLEDIFRRRIPLLILRKLDRRNIKKAAAIAGRILGWSSKRQTKEISVFLHAG